MRHWAALAVVSSALVACNTEVVNFASDAGRDSGQASPLTGKWTGYVENYTLPSGSDVLTFEFATAADGKVSGTVTFGTKAAPPPPTNPDVGYPPGSGSNPLKTASIEGFPYTAQQISFDGSRLQLGISTLELWAQWCALQQPEPPPGVGDAGSDGGSDPWGCNPRLYATNVSTGQCEDLTGPVNCGRAELCTCEVCTCTKASCTVDESAAIDVKFDMQLTGTKLDGSAATHQPFTVSIDPAPPIGNHNVLLTRAP
jgi:hypothetical protein